ncbi:MAG: Type IV pilus assembly protein PilM [candidate division WS6 bacterium 34_10]|uniref:Type IV pilus assembly protein PilM n=1 Tax=candidate division WS6 bacterium 34_10 TaxID=1641389 RepID=A0A101HGW7_9BACT|nr:MAG: Type IV pilus assembly protein PilM [candidate division WS6 bacterium 34_10]
MAKLPDHVGIDFGTHSVKAVELSNITTNPKLVNFGSQTTPQGVINSEEKKDQKKLADVVKKLYNDSKIKNTSIVVALPEFSVFTRFLEFPGVKKEELKDAVFYEAKQYIPVPIEEVRMSYVPIGFNEAKNAPRVLLVAAPLKIIESYIKVTEIAGLEIVAIETESVALGRAMYRATKQKHVVMLDFGANSTDMSIMMEGYLVFSQSISIGSDALTQAIVNKFNFEYNQAEEYKRNYGVTPDVLENKIYNVLTPILESIVIEVNRGIEFYKNKTLTNAPTEFFLTGDGALLPGLADYLSKALHVNATIANPWSNIQVERKFQDIISKSGPSYSVAIGLALKDE